VNLRECPFSCPCVKIEPRWVLALNLSWRKFGGALAVVVVSSVGALDEASKELSKLLFASSFVLCALFCHLDCFYVQVVMNFPTIES
jgi:hypothetical protein